MGIIPSNIAGSIVAGVDKQNQVAKESDARTNKAAHHAQDIKKLIEQHLESVEDSYETTDDPLTVDKDGRKNQQNSQRKKEQDSEELDDEGHLDVTA